MPDSGRPSPCVYRDGIRGWRECSYGFPQELSHYTNCVLDDEEPLETGEDGREVLRIICAAYESARTGQCADFPWDPPVWAHSPIHCWKPRLSPDCPEGPKMEDQ